MEKTIAAPKAKFALCMNRFDAPHEFRVATHLTTMPIPESFWDSRTRMIDRAICEIDQMTLQFIPYIVLRRGDEKIFVYHRGLGGEEARLHGQLSIGLGGHVDSVPGPDGLEVHLIEEACRELSEEVGVDDAEEDIQFTHLICDPTNSVGLVHLGLLAVMDIGDYELTLEKEMIEHGRWLSLEEILDPEVFGRLENWSKATVFTLEAMQGRTILHNPA